MTPTESVTVFEKLATLEQQIADMAHSVKDLNTQVTRIANQVTEMQRRNDWNDVQVGQVLRVLATAVREIRQTQVYNMLNDGPVSTQALRELLQHVTVDRTEPVLILAERLRRATGE